MDINYLGKAILDKLTNLLRIRYVEKIDGKGLSTNDYTDADKARNVQPDWNAKYGPAKILNLPRFADVATSGKYSDLKGKPEFADVAMSGDYEDLTNKPSVDRNISPLGTEPLVTNTLYIGGVETNAILDLPLGEFGKFIQVDFVSGETPTTLVVKSSAGAYFSDIDLVPEPNTIYSLYFDYGICDYGSYDGIMDTMEIYGWKFAYAEYAPSGV